LAQVVPPNTWRIVGDRLRDDEFYIPDNDEIRSMQLGAEWARRRGMALVRTFATGGIAASGNPASGFAPVAPVINIDARGATKESVRILEQSTIPKLTRMLTQQVGKWA